MSKMIDHIAGVIFREKAGEAWAKEAAAKVIESMRTPTDEMRDAGAIYLANGKSAVTDALGTWQSMIDKALSE